MIAETHVVMQAGPSEPIMAVRIFVSVPPLVENFPTIIFLKYLHLPLDWLVFPRFPSDIIRHVIIRYFSALNTSTDIINHHTSKHVHQPSCCNCGHLRELHRRPWRLSSVAITNRLISRSEACGSNGLVWVLLWCHLQWIIFVQDWGDAPPIRWAIPARLEQ